MLAKLSSYSRLNSFSKENKIKFLDILNQNNAIIYHFCVLFDNLAQDTRLNRTRTKVEINISTVANFDILFLRHHPSDDHFETWSTLHTVLRKPKSCLYVYHIFQLRSFWCSQIKWEHSNLGLSTCLCLILTWPVTFWLVLSTTLIFCMLVLMDSQAL